MGHTHTHLYNVHNVSKLTSVPRNTYKFKNNSRTLQNLINVLKLAGARNENLGVVALIQMVKTASKAMFCPLLSYDKFSSSQGIHIWKAKTKLKNIQPYLSTVLHLERN